MKRVLIVTAIALGIWSGGTARLSAFRAPETPSLPNFDRRLAHLSKQEAELAPDKAVAADELRQRVPGLRIDVDRLLGTPNYLASSQSFLSGPGGQGGSISSATANAFAADDPHRALKAFLQEHAALFGYGAEVLDTATVKRNYVTAHNGLRTTIWEQKFDGVGVFGTILTSHITKNGELANVTVRLVPDLFRAVESGVPNYAQIKDALPVSARQAVVTAAQNVGDTLTIAQVIPLTEQPAGPEQEQKFNAQPALRGETIVKRSWLPMNGEVMRICYQVLLKSGSRKGEMYQLLVDAQSGEVLVRRCLTDHLQNITFNVYTNDSPAPMTPGLPNPGTVQAPMVPRTLMTFSALSTNASPDGWIPDNGNETIGNNVDAHTDWDANDQPDLPRPQGNPARVFDFPMDFTQDPTNYAAASVVQLFYLNNFMHDKLYDLGFTEAAGNFQTQNFGRGGLGGDAVMADGQDGEGFNNAYMSTPPDGYPANMAMFLFNSTSPNRDGSLDAQIVFHEYTHGLSNRRVGGGVGMSALQSRGMGEGWSDFYSLALLAEASDDIDAAYPEGGYVDYLAIPGYMQNYYFGVRRYPYSQDMTKNPLTLKDIDPTQADPHTGVPLSPLFSPFDPGMADEVHNSGEVWCMVLWEARVNIVRKYGFAVGNQMILQLVTDGMNLSPVDPTFLQARDAIIQADLINNGGANAFELWRAFAKRGMGGSAYAPASDTCVGIVESYDLPGLALFRATSSDSSTSNGNGAIDPNECNELTIVLVNNSDKRATSVQATLISLNTNVVVSQADSPYPVMLPGALGTNLVPFRIFTRPEFVCGSSIQLALQVRSEQDVRTFRVNLETGLIGPATRFDSTAAVDIPDFNTAGVDSAITVANFSNTVGKVTVSLFIPHDFIFDLDITLYAPDGTSVTLANNLRFYGTNFGIACFPDTNRTTFDDKATQSINSDSAPYVGTFKPVEPLAAFEFKSGAEVNGTWRLHVTDSYNSNAVGRIECWSLNLSPMQCTNGYGECPTDLAVYSSVGPIRPVAGSNWTYSVTVINEGQNIARNVMLTNTLPTGVLYLTNSAGGNLNRGNVICSLGNLASGVPTTIYFTVRPLAEGPVTNIAFVTTETPELTLSNNISVLTTTVRPAAPLVVAAGSRMIAESFSPASGAIDIGETVTIDFALQNIGVLNTTNLIATLQSINGVISPSGPQRYGALLADGPSVAKSFTFTAAGTNGGAVIATFQLQDGAKNLGTVAFPFGLSSDVSVPATGGINIPDHGPAALYPAPIFVSGVYGLISKVSVSLKGLNHKFPEDLNVLLVGPGGQRVMLMSDAGGGTPLQNVDLTFEDAGTALPDEDRIVSGTYSPTSYDANPMLTNPAPAGPYGAELSAFNGIQPEGVWALFIFDDTPGDAGRLAGGWTLDFKLLDPVNPTADLLVMVTNAPNPAMIGSNVIYTVTVVNRGPDLATGVMVTNTPPAALTNLMAVSSQGVCTVTNGKVICALGTVTNQATVFVAGKATASGTNKFTVFAAGNEQDANWSNNSATLAAVVTPQTDLGLLLSTTPALITRGSRFSYLVVVTNKGPDDAFEVVVTNTLPTEVTFISALTSQGSSSVLTNRLISWFAGNVAKLSKATLTVVCQVPDAVITLSNAAVLSARSPLDVVSSNNAVTLVSQVVDPDKFVVAEGSILVAEKAPFTGGIEPGEQVTMNFVLRNIGVSNTTRLVATLRNTGGVTVSSGPADYGVLAAGGLAVARPFTFTANGAFGATIDATLDLQDGAENLGAIKFSFILGGAQRSFANSTRTTIPDNNRAAPYPSVINVSGLTGAVGKVTVTLKGLSHTYPDDLDILLVGPQGQGVVIMSDAGGGHSFTNITLTIDDAAAAALSDTGPIQSGAFKPGNYPPADAFPAPAPAGPYGSTLAAFTGASPNGVWSLYVRDDYLGDIGSLDGWSLDITTVGLLNYPPAELLTATISATGEFRFSISGRLGEMYLIQTSTDLVNWTDLSTLTLSDGTAQFADPQTGSHPRRFYRAIKK